MFDLNKICIYRITQTHHGRKKMLPLTTLETTPHQDLAQDMTMTTMENGSDTTAASI